MYTGFSGELKAGTEVAATAKMPLLTPCPTYNQEAHKPVLPEKLRGREVMVGSGLKIEIMSVQDMGLCWVKEASAHRPAEDRPLLPLEVKVVLTRGRTRSAHGWLLPSHGQGGADRREIIWIMESQGDREILCREYR